MQFAVFYHALPIILMKIFFPHKRHSNLLLGCPGICPSSPAGIVGGGQLPLGGDKLCLVLPHASGSLWFDRNGLWALCSSPTPTTSLTHQACVVARDCKEMCRSGKRGETWRYSAQKVGPSFFPPINKASLYMTTASEVWFSGCCSCLVKLFTTVHFSQPVQKHLTMKSVTNALFFEYTVPSSPCLNKLEKDFQSS